MDLTLVVQMRAGYFFILYTSAWTWLNLEPGGAKVVHLMEENDIGADFPRRRDQSTKTILVMSAVFSLPIVFPHCKQNAF